MAGGRQFLAQVILSLRDGLSGPARAAAGSLKGVEKGIKDLKATAEASGNIGLNLARNMNALRPTAQMVDQITVGYRRLGEEMRRAERSPSQIEASTRRFSNSVVTELARARGAVLSLAGAYGQLHRAGSFAAGSALRAAGVVGGVYGGGMAARNVATAGAQRMRQTERERNAGLSAEELANLNVQSRVLGRAFPSINDVRMREIGQIATTTAPNIEAASSMMDTLARFYVKMQTLRGLQGADRGLEDMIKAMDIMQRVEDPRQFRSLVDALTRAMGVEGGQQLNPSEILAMAKRARTAGMSLNDRFIGTIAPTMIQQGSGDNVGTSLMTLMMNAAGLRQRRELNQYLIRDGLMTPRRVEERDARGRRVRGWRGDYVDGDLLRSNPYDWVQRHVAPLIRRDLGLGEGQELGQQHASQVMDWLGKRYGDRNTLGPVSDWLISRSQYERNARRYDGNREGGLANAESARQRDPYIAFQSVMERMSAAAAEFAIPLITQAIPAMNDFAGKLTELGNYFRENTSGIQTFGSAIGRVFSAIFDIGGQLLDIASPLTGLIVPGLQAFASALETVAAALRGMRWFFDAYASMNPLRGANPLESHNLGRQQRAEADARRREALDALFNDGGMEQVINDERLLRNRVRQRDADAQAYAPGSAIGQSRAAFNAAEIGKLTDSIITQAAAAGHGMGDNLGQSITRGIETSGPLAVSAAQRIMEQIRATMSSGVNVPINLQPSGGAAAPSTGSPPGRALGGPVSAGNIYQVGEAGPELFRPTESGTIIPNHRLGEETTHADAGRGYGGQSSSARPYAADAGSRTPARTPSNRASRRVVVNMGGITINGGNATEIADKIADELKSALAGGFTDGEEAWG